MKNEPVFLTDKNHNIILESITGTPNAALPDSLKPFEVGTQYFRRRCRKACPRY